MLYGTVHNKTALRNILYHSYGVYFMNDAAQKHTF